MPVTIYALVDPRTDEIRYIGKTSIKPERRLTQHLYDSTTPKTRKDYWIRSLGKTLPELHILEVCSDSTWRELEAYWISLGRAIGWNLTNLTDGGDGCDGFKHHAETKEKLSEIARRRSITPAMLAGRRKSSDARRGKPGRKHSDETKRRMSITRKGRGKGRKLSEEHRKKISVSNMGKKFSPETIEKMRRASQQRMSSAEFRKRLSDIQKERYATLKKQQETNTP